jgi:SAM-dependent methyltransferase
MEDFYGDSELYDLVASVSKEMERHYLARAGLPGSRVLDLGCGTGRIALPLAECGATVVGGDLSEVMLAGARRAAQARGVTAEFVRLDMRDFDLGRTFDRFIVAANSIAHLLTSEDLVAAFAAIRGHLADDGQFLFDIFVPSACLLSLPGGRREPVGTFDHPKLGPVTIEEAISYDPALQVSRSTWFWSAPARPDFRQTLLELRQIYPQELPLLLSAAGLKLVDRRGDFDGSGFSAESWQQVCVAVAG